MKSQLILTLIFLLPFVKTANLPTVVFHGIHDDCHGWMKEVAINITKQTGAYSECLNIGIEDKYISIFESMKSQAEQECKKIIKHPVFG